MEIRLFGVIRSAVDGGFAVSRDDDGPHAFLAANEAKASGVGIGDRVIFSLRPGGMAHDVVLARRARQLTAQEAAK